MTPSPLFNFNFVLLQTRLLSLQTTTLHFLIVTNKRYNFNFCPCLSLWTRLSNFSFCMHNICPFGLQLLQRSLLLQLSQPLALQCFRFVQLSAVSTFASAFFPFRLFSFTFLSSIDLFFNFLFVSSRSIQFRRTPKSRRHDPCSKGFREVTHRLSYFEVC